MKYDFVSFGDVVIDAFIKLREAHLTCDAATHENCELCMKFGQKIPFESATVVYAVGNGPNAAVSAARIGLNSAACVELGDDENGQRCVQVLKDFGVDTRYVSAHKGIPTNYHYVLMYEAERTILIKHEHFPRTQPQFDEPPAWFYVTSLGEGTEEFQHWVATYAKENGVKVCFQPGTFQIKMGKEKMADLYQVAEIFFCNKEESQMILGLPDEHDVRKLLEAMRALGPKIVVITDGRNGSSIMDERGAWHIPMYPDPAPPVSRTGAGDATASTTVAYMHLGLSPQEALMRGMINAASVVQGIGAQTKLLKKDEIEEWYAKRPADFIATPL